MAEDDRRELPALTSLRFFAAASILAFHMLGGFKIERWTSISWLASGVSLFFVLSGFILTYKHDGTGATIGRFYLGRVARLWPMHLAAIALLFLLVPGMVNWAGNVAAPGDPFWKAGSVIFWANLLLVHAWLPFSAYDLSFNVVTWSISVEMFFYALFPFLLMLRLRWAIIACMAATIGGLAYIDLTGVSAPTADVWRASWYDAAIHFPPFRLFEFVLGMGTARLYMAVKGKWTSPHATLAEGLSIAAAVGASIAFHRLEPMGATGYWLSQSGASGLFALVILLFALGHGRISAALHHPILVRLGEVSFSTYMVHHIIMRYGTGLPLKDYWGLPGAIAGTVIASYAVSYVMWAAVEKPAHKAILKWFSAAAPSRDRAWATPQPQQEG